MGTELTAPAAADGLGALRRTAEEILERLVDAQLLHSDAPDRYRSHPPARLFALELAR